MNPQTVKYFWLRDSGNNPVACIASHPLNLWPGVTLGIGFAISVYNPSDKFSKAEGRELAAHRLLESGCFCFDPAYIGLAYGSEGIKRQILETVANRKELPSRVREAAGYQLGELDKQELCPCCGQHAYEDVDNLIHNLDGTLHTCPTLKDKYNYRELLNTVGTGCSAPALFGGRS